MKLVFIALLGVFSVVFALDAKAQALCLAFSPSIVSGPVGSTIEVKAIAVTFDSLIAMQFPMVYDQTVLEFDSVYIPSPSPLPNFFYAEPPSNTSIYGLNPGKVTLVWFDPAGAPHSLISGMLLFTIRFKIKSSGSTTVAIKNAPPPSISIVGQNDTPAAFTNPCTALVGQSEVNNDQIIIASIAPNPFSSSTKLTVTTAEDTEMEMYITDITGRICFQKNMYLKQGITGTEIACTMLHEAGMYFVHLVSDRVHTVQSIVYQ